MASRIIQGLGWTTASSITRNAVQLGQLAILTRFLDKTDFGIVAIAHMFIGFTSMFLDMGISVGIIHRQSISNKEYSSLFWFNILCGVLLTTCLLLIAPIITYSYQSQDLTNVVQLISITLLLNALGTQQRTYCQKKMFFKRLALIEIIGSIFTMSIAVTTALLGWGVYSLAFSTIAGALFINITHLVIGIIKDSRIFLHFSIKEIIPFLKIGIFQVGSSILDFLTRELDIIIVSATLGLEFLGVYNIAKRIPVALYSFIQPIIGKVFAPILAEKQELIDNLRNNYIRLSRTLSWFSFPLYLFVGAVSPTIISIVFGENYLEGIPIMMVFCFAYAFNGFNGVCGALQTATGRTDIGLMWTIYLIIVTSIVYYVTSLFGIPIFLMGIVLLVLIDAVMMWLIQYKRMIGVTFREYFSIFSRSFLFSVPLAVSVYFVHSEPSLFYTILAGCIFVVLFYYLLLKSKDGAEVISVMNILKIPENITESVKKIKYSKIL